MKFEKGQNYLLVEIEGALVILDNVRMRPPAAKHQPLLIADAGPMLTYLDRFFFERENGCTLVEAHELALQTAKITTILPPACGGGKLDS